MKSGKKVASVTFFVICMLDLGHINGNLTAMNTNYYVLLIFAPLLILTGILGFVIPREKGLTSGAPAYNIFHILFGLLGLGLVYSHIGVRLFNIGFGAIDLYQAVASFLHLFPEKQFQWKRADDVLHIAIGLVLVGIGIIAP